MKTLTKTLVCVCGLTLIPLALNAANEQASQLKEYQLPEYTVEDLSPPIPTKTVAPRVSHSQIGQEIKMLFGIDENGRAIAPRAISSFADPDLRASMSIALSYWKFEPARDINGQAVAVKAALTVKVVKKIKGEKTYVGFDLGKLEIIRRTN